MTVILEAYSVVTDTPPCPHCGRGATFHVVEPNGIAGSTSYENEEDAEHEADILNAAFRKGREHAFDAMARATAMEKSGLR
jgi:hypothetical protein